MGLFVYLLCALTSLACAWLLLRAYRRNGVRLLLWSGLCFACLALNNVLLVVDSQVAQRDLSVLRSLPTLLGIGLLLYGLVWETER